MTKRFILLYALAAALILVSCQENRQLKSTPYIAMSYLMVNPITHGDTLVGAQDTLGVRFLADSNLYLLDTLVLGRDSMVRFTAAFGSYSNNLMSACILSDTTALKFSAHLNEDILNVLVEPSSPEEVKLYLTPGYNYLSFPVVYRPRRAGTYDFTLMVESDAGSGYSPVLLTCRQPVK